MADGVKKINEWIMKDGRIIGITKDIKADKFEGGTFFVNPQVGDLKFNKIDSTGAKSWKHFEPVTIFDEKTIVRSLIADKAINSDKINTDAVTEEKIKNGAVTENKIYKLSVSESKIKDGAVTENKLATNSVTNLKIKNDAVTEEKIKNNAVTTDKIAQRAIINGHIADGTIQDAKMFPKTLTNASIKNETIIESLLATDSVTENKIKANSIKTKHIAELQVQTLQLGNKAVTKEKIADKAIVDTHFSKNTINADKLLNGSITEVQLDTDSVVNSKIKDGAVDIDKLDNSTRTLIQESIRVEGSDQIATVKGNLKVNGYITATGNITGAKVFNPVFADIAEAYIPTCEFEIGEAVCLCPEGGLKIEKLREDNCSYFLGFVSNQYAACYGATPEEIESGAKVAIALTGRIPVKAQGSIGDFITIEKGTICAESIGSTRAFFKPKEAIGRIIDIIDDKTVLVQV